MSDEHNEKHDKNQKNSEKPQQYFVEGYFDTAYSMPAETDPTHSYQIKASSALPAFPPLNDRDPDGDKLRSARPLILILVGLLAALLLLTVIRFALRYDLTISRENGTIHITIHRKAGSEALLDGVIPTQAGTEGVVENDGSTVQPSPVPTNMTAVLLSLPESRRISRSSATSRSTKTVSIRWYPSIRFLKTAKRQARA
jgi:hypothetical protein